MLALLASIALLRLPANSQWRLYPYNWQWCAGLITTIVAAYGTVFLHWYTNDAHRSVGALCNGLYGWLTVAFVADIALCVMVAVLGVWYTVRLIRG